MGKVAGVDQHTGARRGLILAGGFVLFAGGIGMEAPSWRLAAAGSPKSAFGDLIGVLSGIQHFPNLEFAVHLAVFYGGWIVAWRLARLAGSLTQEGLLRALGWAGMASGMVLSAVHAAGRIAWLVKDHDVALEQLCALGLLFDLLSVGAVAWYLPWALSKATETAIRVRIGLLISALYILRHLSERQTLMLLDSGPYRADASIPGVYWDCMTAIPPAAWGGMVGCAIVALGSGLGLWWKQRVLAMVKPAPVEGGPPPKPTAPEPASVRRGRRVVRYGAFLLVCCVSLPAIEGCSKDIVPVVYLAQEAGDVDDAADLGQWVAILLPYLLGGLVLVRTTARVYGHSAIERAAVWAGAFWYLAAGAAAGLYASGNLRWLSPDRLFQIGDWDNYLYALGVIFGLACPVVAIGFLVWAVRWAREIDRRIRIGQLLAAVFCFDWFVYWPILYVVNDDLDDSRIGLWLSLLSCAMIAAGTLWEFPRSRRAHDEVEREFGPREGHEPGDRRTV